MAAAIVVHAGQQNLAAAKNIPANAAAAAGLLLLFLLLLYMHADRTNYTVATASVVAAARPCAAAFST